MLVQNKDFRLNLLAAFVLIHLFLALSPAYLIAFLLTGLKPPLGQNLYLRLLKSDPVPDILRQVQVIFQGKELSITGRVPIEVTKIEMIRTSMHECLRVSK